MKANQKIQNKKTPLTVKVTLWVILAVGFVWIGFSLYMAAGLHPSFAKLGAYRWIMAAMTFAAGLVSLILWLMLRKRWRPAWYMAVIALGLMTLAGLFDQVGWVDVLVMLGSAVPLVLLIIDRKWYLKAKS